MNTFVQAIADFVVQHPNWANLLVFLTAAAEAIAVIGAIVPGTAILIGVGAVVGLGHLPLWPMVIWAILTRACFLDGSVSGVDEIVGTFGWREVCAQRADAVSCFLDGSFGRLAQGSC